MELIPGLDNNVASHCLMRLPYNKFDNATIVSKNWRDEIKHPLFHHIRRSTGATQPSIVVVQALVDPVEKEFHGKNWVPNLTYHLSIFNLKASRWSKIPDLPEGIPSCCKVAGVGTELVLIGGIVHDRDDDFLDSVFIFNFISGKWRHGARMPGPRRRHFGCVSDLDRRVYVAGGTDKTCNPCKDFMVYDVSEDKWTILPEMTKARDSCEIMFYEGKLHVTKDHWIGYGLVVNREVDVFDVEKTSWDSVFFEDTLDSGFYMNDGDGVMYKCNNNNVMLRDGVVWKKLVDVPRKVYRVYFATIWERELILVGESEGDDLIKAYAMNLDNNYSWRMLDALHDCTWFVQAGCYLEI